MFTNSEINVWRNNKFALGDHGGNTNLSHWERRNVGKLKAWLEKHVANIIHISADSNLADAASRGLPITHSEENVKEIIMRVIERPIIPHTVLVLNETAVTDVEEFPDAKIFIKPWEWPETKDRLNGVDIEQMWTSLYEQAV